MALALLLGGVHCARPPEPSPARERVRPSPGARDVELPEDTSASFTLRAPGPDGEALLYAVVVGPRHGTLFGTPPELTYTPDADFHGTDSFTFTATGRASAAPPVRVSIRVKPVNDVPVAESQAVTTGQDTAVAFVLAARDADGSTLQLVLTGPPAHGTVTGTPPHLTYTPEGGFHGADSFRYRVSDGRLSSREATVALTVTPGAPVARRRPFSVVQGRAAPARLEGSGR